MKELVLVGGIWKVCTNEGFTGCQKFFFLFFLLGILKDENGNPFKCACCKENAVQCGYPLHEYCAKKWNVDKGCVKSKMSCVPSKEYCLEFFLCSLSE